MILPLLAALAVAVTPPTWRPGEEIITAQDLKQACDKPTDPLQSLPCVYYFRGVLAMAEFDRQSMYDRYGVLPAHRLPLFCAPPGVSTFDLLSRVTKAVAANTRLGQEGAAKTLVGVLQKAYPC